MGFFDKKEKKPKADFSKVESGSSTAPDVEAQEEGRPTTYTVRKGDTLSAIAKERYGDAGDWRRIYEANRDKIDNPDLIYPGQELTIPESEGGAR